MDIDTPIISLDLPTQSYPPQHNPTASSHNHTLANMLPSKPRSLSTTDIGMPFSGTQTSARKFPPPPFSAFKYSSDPADMLSKQTPFVPPIVKLVNTTNAELLSYLFRKKISPQYLATLDIHIAAEIRANSSGVLDSVTTMKALPLEAYYYGRPLEVYLRAISMCKSVATYPDGVWSMDGKEVQKLSGCVDAELLAYMGNNNISPDVLEGADLTVKMNEQNMRVEKHARCRPVLWREKLALVARNASPIDLLKFLMYHSYSTIRQQGHSECYFNHQRAMTDLEGDHQHNEPAKRYNGAPAPGFAVTHTMRHRLRHRKIRSARRGYDSWTPAHDLLRTVKEEADSNYRERSTDMTTKDIGDRLLGNRYEGPQRAARMANIGRGRALQKLQLGGQMDFGSGTGSAPIRCFSQLSIAGDHPVKVGERSNLTLGNTVKKEEQVVFVKEEEKGVLINEKETDDTLLDQLYIGDDRQSDRHELMQRGPHQEAKHYNDNQSRIGAANHASHKEARKTARIAELSQRLMDLNEQISTLRDGNSAKENKHISALKQLALAAHLGIAKAEGKMSDREVQILMHNSGKKARRRRREALRLSEFQKDAKDARMKEMVVRQQRKEVDDLTGEFAHLMRQNA